MTPPTNAALYRVIEGTWPAASQHRLGPWTIRDGQGGGQRVSATTVEDAWTISDISAAEVAMRDLKQPDIFMIRDGDDALDAALADRNYAIVDPVALYLTPVKTLTDKPIPPVSAFQIWPPLAIMAEIWAEGGIGTARLAVMERAKLPKTAILARANDQPAGTAFIGLHEDIAMIHAIEVTLAQRNQGVGRNIMRSAGHWARDQGADWLALAVTKANSTANALYTSLGMQVVGQYHYRKRTGQA